MRADFGNAPAFQAAILAAAVKVFFQFGYRKTSMEDVAAVAEVSRQTLYLQFRDKERLFRAALDYLTEQMLVSIRRLAGNQNGTCGANTDGRIRGSLRRFARRFVPDQHCGVGGSRAISGGKHRFPLRGGCAFSHCRYPDAGRRGRSMGAAWNRRAGTGDASSRHFGWRQVGDRKPV